MSEFRDVSHLPVQDFDPRIVFGDAPEPVIAFIERFLVGYCVELTTAEFRQFGFRVEGWKSGDDPTGTILLCGELLSDPDWNDTGVKVNIPWMSLREIRVH